jgi:hypothetical protein
MQFSWFILQMLLMTISLKFIQALQLCSSLNGPFCPFINGKTVPQNLIDLPVTDIFDDPPQFERMINDLLQQIQTKTKMISHKKHLSVIIEQGSFELKGFYILKENFVYLLPTKWIRKPGKNWITIGLFGGQITQLSTIVMNQKRQDHVPTMILSVMDETTKLKIDTCSPLLLRKVSKGLNRKNSYDGIWQGQYSCLGSRTQAKLIIVAHGNKSRKLLHAKLSFRAENFPTRDSTLAGCKCLQEWHFDGAVFRDGECGRPPTDAERPWCFIEEGTCTRHPSGLNWDYCSRARADPVEANTNNNGMRLGGGPFYFNHEGELIQVEGLNEHDQNDDPEQNQILNQA